MSDRGPIGRPALPTPRRLWACFMRPRFAQQVLPQRAELPTCHPQPLRWQPCGADAPLSGAPKASLCTADERGRTVGTTGQGWCTCSLAPDSSVPARRESDSMPVAQRLEKVVSEIATRKAAAVQLAQELTRHAPPLCLLLHSVEQRGWHDHRPALQPAACSMCTPDCLLQPAAAALSQRGAQTMLSMLLTMGAFPSCLAARTQCPGFTFERQRCPVQLVACQAPCPADALAAGRTRRSTRPAPRAPPWLRMHARPALRRCAQRRVPPAVLRHLDVLPRSPWWQMEIWSCMWLHCC